MNGILSVFRATAVFTVTAAGTGTAEEEVGGASITHKDGVGDGGDRPIREWLLDRR